MRFDASAFVKASSNCSPVSRHKVSRYERWGGDEFAILAPSTSANAAHSSAERLVARVDDQHDAHLGRRPTVSIGVATYDPAEGSGNAALGLDCQAHCNRP